MKNILILAVCAVVLSGCLPSTKEGRPWYGESFAGTPEHRALEAKYAAQRQEAAKQDAARLAREQYIARQVAECEEQSFRQSRVFLPGKPSDYSWSSCESIRLHLQMER